MPVQRYARIAGICFLLSILAGGFGEGYVPPRIIVAGNAGATTSAIAQHETLFRLGFAAYLIEALCDVAIALLLYALLRPVQNDVALLSAFFGLVATAVYALGEVALFTMVSKNGSNVFAQLYFAYAANVSLVFYGTASLLRGYLMYRSTYFPRFLGALLMIAGCSFVATTFLYVLAPRYASGLLLVPMFLALMAMTVWFLVKGVDVSKWELKRRSEQSA